jgi:hypothetical protein
VAAMSDPARDEPVVGHDPANAPSGDLGGATAYGGDGEPERKESGMSDTSGLPNADGQGVPAEDRPERFEDGAGGRAAAGHGADAPEPSDRAPREGAEQRGGHGDGPSAPHDTGVVPEGAEDVTASAASGSDGAEPPPADFDPAQQPSNPDLVKNTEPPD